MNRITVELRTLKHLILGLDYDSGQKVFSLQFNLIDAQDRFGNQNVWPGTLLVEIDDIPDNPPLWTSPCIYKTFKEEMPGKTLSIKCIVL